MKIVEIANKKYKKNATLAAMVPFTASRQMKDMENALWA